MKSFCLVSAQYLPHVGGVENYVFHLSHELAARGHRVTVLTSSMEGCPDYERDGEIEIYRLPSLSLMGGRFPVLKPSSARRAFVRHLKATHYDLMLVNMRFFPLSLWAVRMAKRYGIRAIMIDHGSSHLNTGSPLTTKLSEWFEHGITFLEKRYCREFAGVSKESLLWLKHFGIRAEILLNNAVDIDAFEEYRDHPVRSFRAELGIPATDTVITFVGRLTVEKGFGELTHAVTALQKTRPDVWLLAAGEGYMRERLADVLNDKTVLLGNLPSGEVAALLGESDIFCLPSYSEGFPTCVIEACVCRTFVITTEKGDAKEIVKDADHGIILKEHTEEAVKDALSSVLDREDYRRAAAERCYEIVKNNYTWRHTADAILRLTDTENK